MITQCGSCGADIRPGLAFCPRCGKPAAAPQPIAARPKGGKPVWFILLTICVCALFGYLFIDHLPGGQHPVIAAQPGVEGAATGGHVDQVPVRATVEGQTISIPLAEVVAKRIVEFEYSDGTVTVPLLAFISGEGKLVTAFRMCEPCNSTKYSIDGDRLSCGNCETQWSLNTLEGLQGSCQKYPPEPFPSVIEGDRVVMSIARVKDWKIRL
jgi:hypothetical protein